MIKEDMTNDLGVSLVPETQSIWVNGSVIV